MTTAKLLKPCGMSITPTTRSAARSVISKSPSLYGGWHDHRGRIAAGDADVRLRPESSRVVRGKNEMAQVNVEEVKRLLADIEAEVKPLIMPYYACDGPDGEKGKWFRRTGTKARKKNLVQSDLGAVAINRNGHRGRLGRTSNRLRHFFRAVAGAEKLPLRRSGDHLHLLG